MTTDTDLYLVKLRQHLHRHPELSGQERETAEKIEEELRKTDPDEIVTQLGGYGVAAVYGSGDGPTIMLRSELDALPITEAPSNTNRSLNNGFSHACGHDGHMAMLIGVARELSKKRPSRGRVIVLFQPSEETGTGAQQVLADPRYASLKADRSYAIHNLPSYKAGSIYIREGTFASASVGMKCNLTGISSHAAFPSQGRNPVKILPEIIQFVEQVNRPDITAEDYAIATITYMSLGEKAFGITPGQAEVGLTLRAVTDQHLEKLSSRIRHKIESVAETARLGLEIEKMEPFAATVNSQKCVQVVSEAAKLAGLSLEQLNAPFPWSEDFGHFSSESEGALIGLGSGVDSPHLHAESYEFNDEIIPAGVSLFMHIIDRELT